jgi:hypothetical protein
MADRPRLAPQLQQLDDVLAERGMPAAARARVEARLHAEARRRAAFTGFRLRWMPALTFAAGAALVLLVVGLRFSDRGSTPQAEVLASRVLGMFTVQGEGCRHRQDAGDTVLDGTCRLVAPSMAIHTWDRARLSADDDAVRLREGTAMFDVTKVEAGGTPTRIAVSHGIIEILGTRFTIEQHATGGHVDLFEGRIRFIGLDGSSTEIAPGQRYTWGQTFAALTLTPPPTEAAPPVEVGSVAAARGAEQDAAGPEAVGPEATGPEAVGPEAVSDEVAGKPEVSEAAEPRRRSSGKDSRTKKGGSSSASAIPSGSDDEATAIIEEVTRLRAAGEYAEAAGILRRADAARRWDRRTAQVLSYELGTILRHLGDKGAACEHWARHQDRFAGGRYARAVADAQAQLGCAAE